MATPSARLYGDGVTDEALARIAARYGFEAMPGGSAPQPNPGGSVKNIVVLEKVDLEHMAPWLSRPVDAYVERIEEEEAPINSETMDGLAAGRLCFSLATSTAYQNDSAAIICEVLTARGILTPIRRSDVELSLHETISNAVVHGNLALPSNTKGDISHFAKFAQSLQNSLTSPEARLRIDVMASWDNEFLDLTVADKGKGYDESKLPLDVDPFAPAGRGLSIIRSLTISTNVTHGGRVITLRFLT